MKINSHVMDFDAALSRLDEVRAAARSLNMSAVPGADDLRASACILRGGVRLLAQGAKHDIHQHNDERAEIAKLLVEAAVELVLAAVYEAVDRTHAKGAPGHPDAPSYAAEELSAEAA